MNRCVSFLKVLAVGAVSGCATLSAQAQYTINTTTLNSYVGVHPRLFADSSTFGTIRSNIAAYPSGVPRWGEMWGQFKAAADFSAAYPPPAYVTPGANDEQPWQEDVGSRMGILAMAYNLTKSTPPSTDTIWLEAEDVPVTAPMALQTDATVSGGKYIGTPTTGTANNPNTQPPSASYYFSSLSLAAYHLWARVYVPDSRVINGWLAIDGVQQNLNVNSSNGAWIWVECGHWYLTPGNHVLTLTYEGAGVSFDKFVLTTDYTLTPTGLGTEQHWLDAANFTLNANGIPPQANNLAVTTSHAPDLQGYYGDALSLSQKWLEAWAGEAANSSTPASSAMPDAQQAVGVNGGNYDVWVRFKAPYQGHDSFYFELDNLGYSSIALDGTSAFPYNTLISPTLLNYNKTLSAPYNGYAYQEWVWRKVASNVALAAGAHTLKATSEAGRASTGAGCQIDRFLVTPTGTAAPVDPNKYLAAACKWALAACSYPNWGTGVYNGSDLAAGGELSGMSLVYDWCHSALSSADLAAIASKLSTQGALMNTASAVSNTSGQWSRNAYLDNINWVTTAGLAAAGLALYGDSGMPDTTPWLQTAMADMNNTMADLASDGADHEGLGYYSAVSQLLKFMDMSKKLMGADMFSTPWFAKSATFRLFYDLPQNAQFGSRTRINIADDGKSNGTSIYEWGGPDYQLRKLASQYNIPTAQWQAEKYAAANWNASANQLNGGGGDPWLNLIWYASSVPETSPLAAGLPYFTYFNDLDFIVARSGWDGNESVVAYQCGPFMGHGVQAKNKTSPYVNWGGNHAHPDANHFSIFGYGDWQIVNEGYVDTKLTAYSNSLLIGGAGQLGEGALAFNSAAARGEDPGSTLNPAIDTTLSVSTVAMDYLVGNATACYPSADQLTKYRRHLLYLKPDVLVVVDDVALATANSLELRFYPQPQTYTLTGSTYSTVGAHSKLNFNVLTAPSQVVAGTKTVSTLTSQGTVNRLAYSLATNSNLAAMSTAVAFAWSPSAGTPKTVAYLADTDGTAWKFKVGTQTMVLDRAAGNALNNDEKARLVTTLEAESVTLGASMQSSFDTTASGSHYIATTSGTASNTPSDTLGAPSALYSFTTPVSGNYAIWARVFAPNSSENSFYYAVNPSGTPTYTAYASATAYGSWIWVNVASSVSLGAGTNTLGLKYRSAGCRIDQIIVTDDLTYTPVGMY